MIDLLKPVKRKTSAAVFERSRTRSIVVSIEPTKNGAAIGCRLLGSRDTYRIGVNSVYQMAIDLYHRDIEKLAKHIAKQDGVPMRSARARARKEMAKELRSA